MSVQKQDEPLRFLKDKAVNKHIILNSTEGWAIIMMLADTSKICDICIARTYLKLIRVYSAIFSAPSKLYFNILNMY